MAVFCLTNATLEAGSPAPVTPRCSPPPRRAPNRSAAVPSGAAIAAAANSPHYFDALSHWRRPLPGSRPADIIIILRQKGQAVGRRSCNAPGQTTAPTLIGGAATTGCQTPPTGATAAKGRSGSTFKLSLVTKTNNNAR